MIEELERRIAYILSYTERPRDHKEAAHALMEHIGRMLAQARAKGRREGFEAAREGDCYFDVREGLRPGQRYAIIDGNLEFPTFEDWLASLKEARESD